MLLILIGIMVTILEQVFTDHWLSEPGKWYWALLAGVCWFSMLQINIWLYIRRYNMLKRGSTFYTKLINFLPYILLLVQIPDYLTLALSMFGITNFSIFTITSSITVVLVFVIEIIVYVNLVWKMRKIMMFKKFTRPKFLIFKEVVLMIIVLLMDITVLTCGYANCSSVNINLKSTSYLVRLFFLIEVYNEIQQIMRSDGTTGGSYATFSDHAKTGGTHSTPLKDTFSERTTLRTNSTIMLNSP
jgi:hypothetical protein